MTVKLFLELFAQPIAALLLVALVAPLVGAFLRARGTAFHGVVLPQLATFGVALGFAVHPFVESFHDHAPGDEGHEFGRGRILGWAAFAVAVGMVLLRDRARERASAGASAARAAAVFAVASAGTVIAGQFSPHGGLHVEAMLRGEALAIGGPDVALLGAVAGLVLAIVSIRWRRLTVAGQDPEFARAVGIDPAEEGAAFGVATALVVMVGAVTVGALPLFGLLVLPAWALGPGVRSMARLLVLAPPVGLAGTAAGIALAFRADLPVGASVVVGTAAVALLVRALGRWLR